MKRIVQIKEVLKDDRPDLWDGYAGNLRKAGFHSGARLVESYLAGLEVLENGAVDAVQEGGDGRKLIFPGEIRDGQIVRVTETHMTGKRYRVTEGVVTEAFRTGNPMIGGYYVQVGPRNDATVDIELLEDAPKPEPKPVYIVANFAERLRLQDAGVPGHQIVSAYITPALAGRVFSEAIVSRAMVRTWGWDSVLDALLATAAKTGAVVRIVSLDRHIAEMNGVDVAA